MKSIVVGLFYFPATFTFRDKVPFTQEDLVPLHKVIYYKWKGNKHGLAAENLISSAAHNTK